MASDVGKIEAPTAAGDVLAGFQSFAVTTAATAVVSVPAGRTWSGSVTVQCSVQNAAAALAAGQAIGVVTTAGVGVIPAAGTYVQASALAGANAAGGTAGSQGEAHLTVPMVVVAPAGNPVQLQAAATIAGTAGVVNVMAAGVLQ